MDRVAWQATVRGVAKSQTGQSEYRPPPTHTHNLVGRHGQTLPRGRQRFGTQGSVCACWRLRGLGGAVVVGGWT